MTVKWLPSYAPVDEEFGNVSLLLHGDGTNGSTTIVDSSSSPKAVTPFGDAQISTAQSKFGGSSIAFDGTGDYLTIPPSAEFEFGTDPFTVEFWIYPTTSTTNRAVLATADNGNFTTGGIDILGISSNLYFYFGTNSIAVSLPTLNTWNHYAFVGVSPTDTRVYRNGTLEGTSGASRNITYTGQNELVVGARHGGGGPGVGPIQNFFDGYIDDLRITKGVARYTSNFTPPTAPFPDLSPNGRVTIEDNSLDVDARQYIINVEEQDGQSLESGVRTAINDFVAGCKSDGIWDAIKASCILAGARTLDGALVPLVGGAPTKNGTEGDWSYNRKTGLQGNGTDNYLNTNRPDDADDQNDKHYSVYVPNGLTINKSMLGALATSPNRFTSLLGQPIGINFAVNSTGGVDVPPVNATGFMGASRSTSSAISVLSNSVVGTYSQSSVAASNLDIFVLARNFDGTANIFESKPLAFYSIGESLDLAALDTRVSNLITAIGAAIP
jgi:hypothetical protein